MGRHCLKISEVSLATIQSIIKSLKPPASVIISLLGNATPEEVAHSQPELVWALVKLVAIRQKNDNIEVIFFIL